MDHVFIERLWRSLKYEHLYLRAYESLHEFYEEVVRVVLQAVPVL